MSITGGVVRELINLVSFKTDQSSINKARKDFDDFIGDMRKKGLKLSLALTAPFMIGFKKLFETTTYFESLELALETMLGSADRAKNMIKELSEYAAATRFEITDVFSVSKQLISMGVAAEDAKDTFAMLGDIAAGLGVPIQRLAHIFGQVKTATQMSGVHLRRFNYATVPIIEYLALIKNVDKSDVVSLISKGQVSFDDMHNALKMMTSEGNRFHQIALRDAETVGGRWAKLHDKITLSLKDLGETIRDQLKWAIDKLDKFVDWIEGLNSEMKQTIFYFTGFLAVLAPLSVIFSSLVLLAKSLTFTLGALKGAAIAAKFGMAGMLLNAIRLVAVLMAKFVALFLILEDINHFFTNPGGSLLEHYIGSWADLKSKLDGFRDMFKGFGTLASGVFTLDVDKTIKGFEEIFASLGVLWEDLIKPTGKYVLESLKKLIPEFGKFITDVFKNYFGSKWDFTSWFGKGSLYELDPEIYKHEKRVKPEKGSKEWRESTFSWKVANWMDRTFGGKSKQKSYEDMPSLGWAKEATDWATNFRKQLDNTNSDTLNKILDDIKRYNTNGMFTKASPTLNLNVNVEANNTDGEKLGIQISDTLKQHLPNFLNMEFLKLNNAVPVGE